MRNNLPQNVSSCSGIKKWQNKKAANSQLRNYERGDEAASNKANNRDSKAVTTISRSWKLKRMVSIEGVVSFCLCFRYCFAHLRCKLIFTMPLSFPISKNFVSPTQSRNTKPKTTGDHKGRPYNNPGLWEAMVDRVYPAR